MTPDAPHETVLEVTGAQARIARVYAEALTAAAAKTGEVDVVGDELAAIVSGVLTGHSTIQEFFASKSIDRKAKFPVLGAGFEHATSLTFRKFLGVLNQNGRLGLLRSIHVAYEKVRDQAAGLVRVRVQTAVRLNEAQTVSLTATLSERLQAKPILEVTTNPELLGGLIVQVGDRVYDTSVRTRLETFRNHLNLMASGTHGA